MLQGYFQSILLLVTFMSYSCKNKKQNIHKKVDQQKNVSQRFDKKQNNGGLQDIML